MIIHTCPQAPHFSFTSGLILLGFLLLGVGGVVGFIRGGKRFLINPDLGGDGDCEPSLVSPPSRVCVDNRVENAVNIDKLLNDNNKN